MTGANGDDIHFWRIPPKCPGLVCCCLTIHLPFTRLSSEMLQVQVHRVFGHDETCFRQCLRNQPLIN